MLLTVIYKQQLINVYKIMRKNYIASFFLFLLIFVGGYITYAFAQDERRPCYYDGIEYPDGYILGEYQCQDGSWVRIQ